MQRVLVTGGSSGIGAATCSLLEERGWQTVAADVRPAEGGCRLDVTDEQAWDEVLDRVWPLDGLVNCAGIRTRASLIDMSVEDFDRMLAVHARGAFLGVRGMARRWVRDRTGGSIVNIASVVATHAVAGQVHYVAAKAAIAMLTKAAAVELAPHRIRVNAIAPGVIRTPMTQDRLGDPEQRAWLAARVPFQRPGEASEVAAAVAFLLSDAASYVTGTLLPVDGGWTAS